MPTPSNISSSVGLIHVSHMFATRMYTISPLTWSTIKASKKSAHPFLARSNSHNEAVSTNSFVTMFGAVPVDFGMNSRTSAPYLNRRSVKIVRSVGQKSDRWSV